MFTRQPRLVEDHDSQEACAAARIKADADDRQGLCPLPMLGGNPDDGDTGIIVLRDSDDRARHARLQVTADAIRSEIARPARAGGQGTSTARRGGEATASLLIDRTAAGERAIVEHERTLREAQGTRERLLDQLPADTVGRLAALDKHVADTQASIAATRRAVDELRQLAAEADQRAEDEAARVGGDVLRQLEACHRGDTGHMTGLCGPCGPDLWKALKVLRLDRGEVAEVRDGDGKTLARF